MKNLNWKKENLRWIDESANERAEVLESKTNDELTYDEIENLYSNEFYLADEEGYALDLKNIKNLIK